MASTHDIWRRRWEALSDDILSRKVEIESHLRANFTAFDPYDRNKIQAIAKILTCLRQFANEYFYYFYDGFNDENNKEVKPTNLYSKEHVLTTILEQIGHDMETLSRIAHDHFAFAGEETLRKADFLADHAIKLAMGEGWFPTLPDETPPVVLSYFQKSPSIRVIPYANVLMLGIPYTARVAQEDFLAIPHEVGHYIFWQGKVKINGIQKSIAQKLFEDAPKVDKWCFRWLEEMFADIYGTFVAGAFIALSFQELQLQNLPKRLVVDDQDHPVPNLRPYIYVKALKEIGFTESARLLNKRWDSILNELEQKHPSLPPNGRTIRKIYFGNNQERPIHTINGKKGAISNKLDLGTDSVDEVMKVIIALFVNRINSDKWLDIVSKVEIDIKRDNLTDVDFIKPSPDIRFKDFIKGSNIESASEFNVQCRDPKELIEKWEELPHEDQPAWFPVWVASGWTTEGPKCLGSSGVC